MAKYEGKPVTINRPVQDVYNSITNLGAYQGLLEQLPAEAKEKVGSVRFTDSSVIIAAAPVGEIQFDVVEKREPELMKLAAANSPVPFEILVHMSADGSNASKVSTELNVEIPAMLRPMIGGKMQEAADKFSELISTFFKV
ncbi:MAG: hypothetical protein K2O88_09940 [Paramuribaculum sp.]|nr:hypothetical protein [Paramuribaculum sp.]